LVKQPPTIAMQKTFLTNNNNNNMRIWNGHQIDEYNFPVISEDRTKPSPSRTISVWVGGEAGTVYVSPQEQEWQDYQKSISPAPDFQWVRDFEDEMDTGVLEGKSGEDGE